MLSKQLQILIAGLFMCVEHCPVFFFAGFSFHFEIIILYERNLVFPGGICKFFFLISK